MHSLSVSVSYYLHSWHTDDVQTLQKKYDLLSSEINRQYLQVIIFSIHNKKKKQA